MTAGVPNFQCNLTRFKSILGKIFALKILILFNIDLSYFFSSQEKYPHCAVLAVNSSFPCFIPLLCEYSYLKL